MKIDQRITKGEQGEDSKELMHGKIEFNPAQESPRCSICKRAIKSGSYVRYENGVPIHRSCALDAGMFDEELKVNAGIEKPIIDVKNGEIVEFKDGGDIIMKTDKSKVPPQPPKKKSK